MPELANRYYRRHNRVICKASRMQPANSLDGICSLVGSCCCQACSTLLQRGCLRLDWIQRIWVVKGCRRKRSVGRYELGNASPSFACHTYVRVAHVHTFTLAYPRTGFQKGRRLVLPTPRPTDHGFASCSLKEMSRRGPRGVV